MPGVHRKLAGTAHAGFSVIELIVSLAIMGTLATFCIPAYFNRPEVTLEKASALLARDLRSTQNRAAIWRQRLGMRFHSHGYDVVDEEGRVVQGPLNQPFHRDYRQDAVFEGIEILELRVGDDRELWYDKRGEAEEDGQILLRYLDNHVRMVSVSRRTGRVKVDGKTSEPAE